jgi:hypothetical protein
VAATAPTKIRFIVIPRFGGVAPFDGGQP